MHGIMSWIVWSEWGKYTKIYQDIRSPNEDVGFQEHKAEVSGNLSTAKTGQLL